MTPAHAPAVEESRRLLRLIALELAFVDPHSRRPADGLLSLVVEFVNSLAAHAPEPVRALAEDARLIVERGPGVAAVLDSDALAALHDWQPRMEEAVIAWAQEAPVSRGQASPSAAQVPTAEQPCTVIPEGVDAELVTLFCSESQDLLQEIEQGVLVLEESPEDPETLATVFRAFHTFKGNSSVMKLAVLQRLAHELESLLDAARRGARRLDRLSIDLILAGADVFRRFIDEMAAQAAGVGVGRQIALPVTAVIEGVRGLLSQGAPTPKPAAVGAVVPAPSPTPGAAVEPATVGVTAAAATAESQAASAAAAPPAGPPSTEVPTPVPMPEPPVVRAAAAGAAGMVRVDTSKLDSLIDLVGELVIAQAMVAQDQELAAAASEPLARSLGRLRGISSELQRTALALRMVPIRGSFQKMARLVRDLSNQLGKEMRLVLEGEETELDRTLVEELGDPLVHMIRNSADHGIEASAERSAQGKDPCGTITLRAFHRGGMVILQVRDDGRGLSVPRIRAKAVERGLVGADETLSDREVLDLIFAPGFSLAKQVTDLSGRGVGMDVVRRNIERLRGTIEIDSVEGAGTTFTISLPLTLAIIEGLVVRVGEERFVVPTLSVRESFRPLPSMLSTVQGRGEVVSVRGTLTPLLRLAERLGTPGAVADPSEGIVMVLESGAESRGVLVDALVGKQEVVIKSLGETFRDRPEFAGAAILGDGRVGLILDAAALVRSKSKHAEAA
ncbi:MAG: chemotaxis protein CheA [Planctomycetia bacterium]